MTVRLGAPAARRIALAAQGFADPVPGAVPDRRHLRRVLRRLHLFQIDSVNVLARAHYLPLFSRLGPYPTQLLDRAGYTAPRELFEYWGHEAALLDVDLYPLMRWRMAREHAWGGVARIAEQRPDLIPWVLAEVRERGPVTAAQIEDDIPRRTGQWGWNWTDVKAVLEWLFWRGEVLVAARNNGFARCYDVPERVLPAAALAAPTPAPEDALRELLRRSAAALGVATESDLRDYFRLPVAGVRAALAELVEQGDLVPATVAGWDRPAYLHRDARTPKRIPAATLLSPFDPVVWRRERTQRLFGVRYRIEIYTPAAQRVHGYYVLPFLLGDQIVARVDLKADRRDSALLVPAAWVEPGAPAHTAAELAGALRRLAGWLGLAEVRPPLAGDFAGPLSRALAPAESGGQQARSGGQQARSGGQQARSGGQRAR